MKYIVIIDAYNAARQFVDLVKQKFGDLEYNRCLHIQSRPTLSQLTKFESDKYVESLSYNGDLDEILSALKKYNVVAVIAGLDVGVELADQLSFALKLPNSNGINKSIAKRDKYEMRRVVAEAGLAVPKFIKSHKLEEILAWMKSDSIKYPIVLKALKSAGSDGVFICQSEIELHNAYQKIFGSKSIMDEINTEVLAESFLNGEEYVVNTVSYDNKHYVTDVWQYQKRFIPGCGFVYDKEFLLPSNSELVTSLIDYNSKVLDALEINYGPAHSEIMFTKDGPVLVEVGARMTGGMNVKLHNLCLGHNQANLTIDCYSDPENFLKQVAKFPYNLQKHGLHTNAILEDEGIVQSISDEVSARLQALPSMVELVIKLRPGQTIAPTRTLMQVPFRCFMANESKEQLKQDYHEVEKLKTQLFKIIPHQKLNTNEAVADYIKKPDVKVKKDHTVLKYGSFALAAVGFFYSCYRLAAPSAPTESPSPKI